MGISSNAERMAFYDNFIAEVKQLVEAHGDTPTRTVIEQFCDQFHPNNNQYCSLDSVSNSVCN